VEKGERKLNIRRGMMSMKKTRIYFECKDFPIAWISFHNK